jgi:hypothetical protein
MKKLLCRLFGHKEEPHNRECQRCGDLIYKPEKPLEFDVFEIILRELSTKELFERLNEYNDKLNCVLEDIDSIKAEIKKRLKYK